MGLFESFFEKKDTNEEDITDENLEGKPVIPKNAAKKREILIKNAATIFADVDISMQFKKNLDKCKIKIVKDYSYIKECYSEIDRIKILLIADTVINTEKELLEEIEELLKRNKDIRIAVFFTDDEFTKEIETRKLLRAKLQDRKVFDVFFPDMNGNFNFDEIGIKLQKPSALEQQEEQEKLENEVEKLKQQLKEKESEISKKNSQIEEVQNQIDEKVDEKVNEKMQTSDDIISDLNKKLAEAKEKAKELECEKQQKQEELQKELKKTREELQNILNEKANEDSNKAEKGAGIFNLQKEDESEKLKEKIKELENALYLAKSEKPTIEEEEIANARRELEEKLTQAKKQHQDELDLFKKEKEQLESERASQEEKLKELEDRLKSKEEVLTSIQDEYEDKIITLKEKLNSKGSANVKGAKQIGIFNVSSGAGATMTGLIIYSEVRSKNKEAVLIAKDTFALRNFMDERDLYEFKDEQDLARLIAIAKRNCKEFIIIDFGTIVTLNSRGDAQADESISAKANLFSELARLDLKIGLAHTGIMQIEKLSYFEDIADSSYIFYIDDFDEELGLISKKEEEEELQKYELKVRRKSELLNDLALFLFDEEIRNEKKKSKTIKERIFSR